MTQKMDFFEDLAVAVEVWTTAAVGAISNEQEDLIWTDSEDPYRKLQKFLSENKVDPELSRLIFSECFRGLTVSFLTILDGGSAMAERGRIYLVDDKGVSLGEGLHNEFVGYLLETGRMA